MAVKRNAAATLAVACALGTSVALAQNVFKDMTSTTSGYGTWDSDLINIEAVAQTGAGVYVAVLDTGLVPNWRDYFPEARIATHLGTGFHQAVTFKAKSNDPCGVETEVGELHSSTWVGSIGSTHGTHVASTILGYFYRANFDAAGGYPLPPIMVRGIAPEVTVIPVKVLSDYQVPARPKCDVPSPSVTEVFGTDAMVAAGIRYATDLKKAGYSPMVISMSLGGPELAQVAKDAIDDAIANGVIVVAAAGNEGISGMGYPGAYAPVISAGSVGWIGEWLYPSGTNAGNPRYRMWWLQDDHPPLLTGSGAIGDPTIADDVYVSDFSSRALPGQQLDVLAPGSWVRGPFPSAAGYSHLPWYSHGISDLVRGGPGNNFYWSGGTSMATPHVASVAALMLQKNPNLGQTQVEAILKTSALPIPASGSRNIYDGAALTTIAWDTDCDGTTCDAVGAGLIQADEAIAATP